MKPDNEALNTADLATAGGAVRGKAHEDIAGREPIVERPAEPIAAVAPGGEPARRPEAVRDRPIKAAEKTGERTPLFSDDDAVHLRQRWSDIQTGFVDEPRRAVE